MNSRQDNRVRSICWIAIALLGALLTARCSPRAPSPTSIVQVPTPVVSNLNMSHTSNEMLPGKEVEVWVNVTVVDPSKPVLYVWSTEGGEIRGQGTEAIAYKAPNAPGVYGITLKVEYGDWNAERSTSIVVPTLVPTPAPTDRPTPTSTPTPTDTPLPTFTHTPTKVSSPTVTFTPPPTPTPTAMPIPPTPTPASTPTVQFPYGPILYEPKQWSVYSVGDTVWFTWERFDLKPDQYYSVRVVLDVEPEAPACVHIQTQNPKESTKNPEAFLKLDCPAGGYYWSVAVATKLPEGSEHEWREDSELNHKNHFGIGMPHPNTPPGDGDIPPDNPTPID